MTIDALRPVLAKLQPTISWDEVEAIVAIAQLVVDIDGREGPEEIKLFFDIGKVLCELAGRKGETVPTFASDEEDEERMSGLASALKGPGTRELAFAVARALASADLDVTPEEDTFVDRIRGVLAISKPRAEEITALVRQARPD